MIILGRSLVVMSNWLGWQSQGGWGGAGAGMLVGCSFRCVNNISVSSAQEA